ncbi:23862_t:CDS:1, partial [Dentiscutata erythropus]
FEFYKGKLNTHRILNYDSEFEYDTLKKKSCGLCKPRDSILGLLN